MTEKLGWINHFPTFLFLSKLRCCSYEFEVSHPAPAKSVLIKLVRCSSVIKKGMYKPEKVLYRVKQDHLDIFIWLRDISHMIYWLISHLSHVTCTTSIARGYKYTLPSQWCEPRTFWPDDLTPSHTYPVPYVPPHLWSLTSGEPLGGSGLLQPPSEGAGVDPYFRKLSKSPLPG